MRYGYKEYKDLDLDLYHKIKMMAEDLDQSLKIHKLRKEVRELMKMKIKRKIQIKIKRPKAKGLLKIKTQIKIKRLKAKGLIKRKTLTY